MFDYTAHGLVASAVRRDLPGGGPQTIGAVLQRPLQRDPNRLAAVGRSARLSYGELDERVERAAAALHAIGVRRHDRVAACLPNDVDILVAFLACARLGAIWVGVNRPLAPPEKSGILLDSGACVYLSDTAGIAEIAPLRDTLPDLAQLVGCDAGAADSHWHRLLGEADAGAYPHVAIDPFEPAAIAYTSGTTGRPKGAVHSHHNILLPGAIQAHKGTFGPDCPQGVMLPLTILNLMVLAPMVAFQDGSCCVCMDSLKPEDIARWVREERIGHFASVPTVMQDLLTSPLVSREDLATLGQPEVGGASISQECQQLYRERFGRRMTIAYGMTEAPTIVTRTDPDSPLQDALCGRAVEQVEILIVDAHGLALPVGEVGEVCVRPARHGPYAGVYTTMLGYWKRPRETAKALAGGMYHTGDLGLLDDKGQLFIRGRQNDLIIRGGANVYPAEVERVLASHPAVGDVAVLGVADERLGQRVGAVVQLAEGAGVDEADLVADLQAHCRAQLARYKVPEHIRFTQALPRNAMNKIVKPALLHLFEEHEWTGGQGA